MIDARPAGPRHHLLLAGSFGPERIPARPDAEQPAWHEPLHVRDARSARDRLSSQVAVGADVILAPTWLTHRRALLPTGETRRARAWTAAAVRIAREAVEVGLERRAAAGAGAAGSGAAGSGGFAAGAAGSAATTGSPARPQPVVAACLPALDDDPDLGTGRLLPREAASERDYHDQAGLLADAEPDLLFLEGQATLASLRLAIDAAGGTGLPSWVALPRAGGVEAGLEAWLDLARESNAALTLLPGTPDAGRPGLESAWGRLVSDPAAIGEDTISSWLAAGAAAVGVLDRATPDHLVPIRAAIDAYQPAELGAAEAAEARWWRHVRHAAAMAPGGGALCLSGSGTRESLAPRLPAGFEWLIVDPSEAGVLPAAHFCLVVDPGERPVAPSLRAALLEEGGVLVVAEGASGLPTDELRLLVLDDTAEPPLAILRRER